MADVRYAIKLRSRQDGEESYLGTAYTTMEAAKKVAAEDICPRCNQFEIYPVDADMVWVNRKIGYATPMRKILTAKTRDGFTSRAVPDFRPNEKSARAMTTKDNK